MLCPNCSKQVPPRAAFCPRCGAALSADGVRADEERAAPVPVAHPRAERLGSDPVQEELLGGPRFRFMMMPPFAMSLVPLVLLILFLMSFGFCVIRL